MLPNVPLSFEKKKPFPVLSLAMLALFACGGSSSSESGLSSEAKEIELSFAFPWLASIKAEEVTELKMGSGNLTVAFGEFACSYSSHIDDARSVLSLASRKAKKIGPYGIAPGSPSSYYLLQTSKEVHLLSFAYNDIFVFENEYYQLVEAGLPSFSHLDATTFRFVSHVSGITYRRVHEEGDPISLPTFDFDAVEFLDVTEEFPVLEPVYSFEIEGLGEVDVYTSRHASFDRFHNGEKLHYSVYGDYDFSPLFDIDVK